MEAQTSDVGLTPASGTHSKFFLGGGGDDCDAIYNLCLILKMAIKIM